MLSRDIIWNKPNISNRYP